MSSDADALLIGELLSEGLIPGEHRWVSHDLCFPLNRTGAFAAYEELGPYPFAVLDEEVDGGDYWHVVVLRRQEVSVESLQAIRAELEPVADKHGGTYDGWALSYRHKGQLLPPEGDPIFGTVDNPNPFV